MPDDSKAVDLAKRAFAAVERVDIGSIVVESVQHQQIPNPPLPPGQMSVNPVRYRFFVQLRAGERARRFRVEAGRVYEE